jgi:uncharacterized protein YlxW (UPF0749 family)
MVNPFVTRQQSKSWVLSLSIVMLFVGMLVSMTWITVATRKDRIDGLSPDVISRLQTGDFDLSDEYEKLQTEIAKLREENARLQQVAAEGSNASTEINDSLKETKLFAGLTDVQGPGITVTLKDSRKPGEEVGFFEAGIVHDLDVLKVVNELWNSGAEAVSVNGKRVGPSTDFRCVGTTIMVDQQQIASPVKIEAIGDQNTLFGAINLPGGALEEMRDVDPNMVKVELAEKLFMTGWAGSTTFKFAKVPAPKAGSKP